jgi:cell division septation protein DedD
VSTSSRAEANRWKEKLAARKYRTAAVSSVESSKGKLWRVRIGPYPDRTQANKAAEKITAEFRQKAWVAPE